MLKLKLPYSENEYLLDKVTYEKTDNGGHFLLQSNEERNININVDYNFTLYDTYKPEEFECFPFLSPLYFKEENIFEVKVNTKIGRIGWIFPIQSLSSTAHSHSNNEHYLKYAFVVFYKLLLGEYFNHDIVFEAIDPSSYLSITDIYNSELIVLCTSKAKTDKIFKFDISDYIPFLYSSHYFHCSNPKELDLLRYVSTAEQITSLTIKHISTLLKDEIFIKSLFRDLLKESNHPLVQFHLLYQIVELLINKVYDSEIENVLLSSKSREKKPHEILKDISVLQTEKYRITKLIDSYLSIHPTSSAELIGLCKQVSQFYPQKNVDDEDKKSLNHAGLAFYFVRNMVVHDFRTISERDSNYAIFKQFVVTFEKFIIEIIINYKDEKAEYNLHSLEWLKYQLQQQ
ncbi:hypothetical protein F0919_16545 [Taibaiella lutea]|uniref:Uncharacterized protein n=1 Tax=Taibaiella lutea TaxID=2608001 RepID=A0A5M6CH02_9BACT|nr:hypothetical protein [Taibaiella lutea]KAA5532399.1 hypothetical protein F0919_16545 [Taibaiella lutea]